MWPDWESNWRPLGSQSGTQSTEPHQPGLLSILLEVVVGMMVIKMDDIKHQSEKFETKSQSIQYWIQILIVKL